MKKLLINVLNARPEEIPSVQLMLLLGFFMGVFLATYDVAAPAIFLNYFEDENILAQAFLVSGFVGIISTAIYSYLQARIPFKILVISFTGLMLLTTTTVWMLSAFRQQHPVVVFIGFVLALPFSYIALLLFWGFFNRVFNLKQAKRLIGGIDTGQLVAAIVALFSITFVINNNIIQTVDLFLVSAIGVTGMLFTSIALFRGHKLHTSQKGDIRKRTLPYRKLFTNPYTKLMVGFILISLIALTMVDYSFLNVINAKWATEAEKTSFLASFEVTVVIFSFLFQTFVTDWLIENYGLKISLLINPFLSVLLIGGAVLVGMFFGYQPGPGVNITYFFLAIAATKLFIDSLKDALDGPTFKLYFLPINSNIKMDVNTKIEGTVMALGGFLAGGLLLLMNQFHLSQIYIVLGVIPVLLIWFYLTQRMYGGYRHTLQNALEEGKKAKSVEMAEEQADSHLDDNNLNKLKMLEKTAPALFEVEMLRLAKEGTGMVQSYAQQKIKEMDLQFDQEKASDTISKLAQDAVHQADSSNVISVSDDRLYTLAKSRQQADRLLAAKLLRSHINDSNIFVLLELLRDPDTEVRKQAIATARKVGRKEAWPLLLELINHGTFTYEAAAALVAAGEEVLPVLENAFHRSGQTLSGMLKIINIMVEIGGPEAHRLLWQKIDFPNRKIVKQVLIALSRQNYQATDKEKLTFNDLLIEEIGKALWSTVALEELSDNDYNQPLKAALNEEIQSNFDFIYILLGLIYDPQSVALVKENMELGTTESIAYAIELLDIFLAKDIKPRLFPLLDDIDAKKKLDKLQIYYPREWYEEQETYHYILNKECTNLNPWTRACTLWAISQNPEMKVDDNIVAHMFNDDIMLAELATWITYNTRPDQYRSVLQRLPGRVQFFERIVHKIERQIPFRFDVVRYLQQLPEFQHITGLLLSQMVEAIHWQTLSSNEELPLHNYRQQLFVLFDGKARVSSELHSVVLPTDTHVAGSWLCHNESSRQILQAQGNVQLLAIPINNIFDIMINYPDMLERFFALAGKPYQTNAVSV